MNETKMESVWKNGDNDNYHFIDNNNRKADEKQVPIINWFPIDHW